MWSKIPPNDNPNRYGALFPIAYFGTQLYCIFSWLETLLKMQIAL